MTQMVGFYDRDIGRYKWPGHGCGQVFIIGGGLCDLCLGGAVFAAFARCRLRRSVEERRTEELAWLHLAVIRLQRQMDALDASLLALDRKSRYYVRFNRNDI